MFLLAIFSSKHFKKSPLDIKVTLLISAYNEEKSIEKKIKNTLKIDYPKLQIIVISDGSTDKTDEIVKKYKNKGIILHKIRKRVGKSEAINKTWHLVKGDIVVFSDANTLYQADAIKNLLRNFADKRIGCVSGELNYVDAKTGMAKSEDIYWKYEKFLYQQEASIGQLLVVNGSIFAIRKELFKPIIPYIANDFQLPQEIAAKGYYIVCESSAVAYEVAAKTTKDEFNRKARIINRGFTGAYHLRHTFKGIRLFELLCHKLLRWFGWLFLLIIFVSNLFLLNSQVFLFLWYTQIIFYLSALLGPFFQRAKIPLVTLPYYFCVINLAALVGLYRFITKKQQAMWEPPNRVE